MEDVGIIKGGFRLIGSENFWNIYHIKDNGIVYRTINIGRCIECGSKAPEHLVKLRKFLERF